MLLRTALFAFSQGIRSTRNIAEKSIDDIFFEISSKIAVDLMDEDLNSQYVD